VVRGFHILQKNKNKNKNLTSQLAGKFTMALQSRLAGKFALSPRKVRGIIAALK